MITKSREKDVIKIIENLDISPTLYKNAVEKYQNIAKFLQGKGLNVDIYPQGSFALGTVVRPYSADDNATYDLDFICQVSNTDRDDIDAKGLRELIKSTLEESELYGGKLEIYDECFTIKYADTNGVGFSIDIVPAVDESYQHKSALIKKALFPELIETAIAIPKQHNKEYEWLTNNPRGYKKWFDDINSKYQTANRTYYREQYFKKHSALYASVEEIPSELERSALQRAIQILKYHRNVFYSKYKDGDKHKPISAIINTVVTEIAKSANPTMNVYELLNYVTGEFYTYSLQLTMHEALFTQRYGNKTVISKKKEKWVIQNPANPEDNLADSWTDETAKVFFKWTSALKTDLIDSLSEDDDSFRVCIENAFGESVVKRTWGDKYKGLKSPTIINSTSGAKPWRMI